MADRTPFDAPDFVTTSDSLNDISTTSFSSDLPDACASGQDKMKIVMVGEPRAKKDKSNKGGESTDEDDDIDDVNMIAAKILKLQRRLRKAQPDKSSSASSSAAAPKPRVQKRSKSAQHTRREKSRSEEHKTAVYAGEVISEPLKQPGRSRDIGLSNVQNDPLPKANLAQDSRVKKS